MIERDIAKAGFGQFVLFSGALSIADLTLIKEAWKLPGMQKLLGIEPSPPISRHANSSARKKAAEPDTNAFALEMLGILPHSVQATLASGSDQVWASLKADCLAAEPSDLTLKHGFRIPGEWSVVGILDAQPNDWLTDTPTVTAGVDGSQAVNLIFQSLAPITRNIMGKPANAYGVTPLLIFREVSAKAPPAPAQS
jgi:muconolactone delta-isomerase